MYFTLISVHIYFIATVTDQCYLKQDLVLNKEYPELFICQDSGRIALVKVDSSYSSFSLEGTSDY